MIAKVGLASGSNLQDLGAGDAIVVVASDLHEEEPIWWLRVNEAAKRGATLVVLNLRETRLDKYAKYAIQYGVGEAVATVRQLVNAAKVETDASDDAIPAAADANRESKECRRFLWRRRTYLRRNRCSG